MSGMRQMHRTAVRVVLTTALAGGAVTVAHEERPALTLTAVSADAASDVTVLDEGHVDFAARVVDGALRLDVKDGTVTGKTTWRAPSSVVLHVKPTAKNTLPDSEELAFLGKAGDPVWLLDQVQQDGLLWPGWSTNEIPADATEGGVKFSLTQAEGPGTVALYTYDAMSGATVLFNSEDGTPDAIDVPPNTHAHGGWAFTEEGTYRLGFTMSGTLANGKQVSDSETVTFVVGDTDPGDVRPGDGSGTDASQRPGTSGSASPDAADAKSGSRPTPDRAADSSSASTASSGPDRTVLLASAAVALTVAGTAAFLIIRHRRNARG